MTRAGTRSAAGGGRRRYNLKNTRVLWTETEKTLFKEGLEQHGRNWRLVTEVVKTKTITQVRSHAQKHFLREEAKAQAEKKAKRAAEKAEARSANFGKSAPSNKATPANAVSATETRVMPAIPNAPNAPNPLFVGDPRLLVYGAPSPPPTPTNFLAYHHQAACNRGAFTAPLHHHTIGMSVYYNVPPRRVAMNHPHPIPFPVAPMHGIAPMYPHPLPGGAVQVAGAGGPMMFPQLPPQMSVPQPLPQMPVPVPMPVAGAGSLMPATNAHGNGGALKTQIVVPEAADQQEKVNEDMLGSVDLLLDASKAMGSGQHTQATARSALPIAELLN